MEFSCRHSGAVSKPYDCLSGVYSLGSGPGVDFPLLYICKYHYTRDKSFVRWWYLFNTRCCLLSLICLLFLALGMLHKWWFWGRPGKVSPTPTDLGAAARGRAEQAECSSLIIMAVRVLHAQKHLRFLKGFIFQDRYQQCRAKHIPLGSERKKKVNLGGVLTTYTHHTV